MQLIKNIFKRREKPHKPLIVERLAACNKWGRYLMILALGALSISLVFAEAYIGLLGAEIIQTDERTRDMQAMLVILPLAIGVIFGVFSGMIMGAKGWVKLIVAAITISLSAYQIAHLAKNRMAVIDSQNAQKQTGDNGAASLDARIKLAQERAAKWDAAAAAIKIPNDWQQRAMQRSKDNAMSQSEKNREEASKLLAEKAKLPPAKPTEAGIVGDSVARLMAASISVLLVLSQWTVNILIGLLFSSFSIHRKIEYVEKNHETHALQPIDQPKPVHKPVREPVREPMPPMPQLGSVPPDAAAAVVLSAGLLGGGSAAVAAQTPTVVASSAAVVDFERLLQTPVALSEECAVAVDTTVAPAPNKRTMDDLRGAIRAGECGTTVTDIREFMDLTHNPAVEARKKLCEEGIIKHYNYNEVKELILAGK